MTIVQIIILTVLALTIGQLPRFRQLVMLAVSSFAVFWLQSAEPFVTLRYWLPVATLGITALCWALTTTSELRNWKDNWPAALILVLIPLLVAASGLLPWEALQIPGTPALPWVLIGLVSLGIVFLLIVRSRTLSAVWRGAMLLGIVAALVVLKSPAITGWLQETLGTLRGSTAAAATPLSWLGFSYLAFRLMHTIRDRQSGRLPPVTLGEYVNYVVFFPSFTAGPIDRIERFVKDLREPLPLANDDWIDAGTRLFVGLFKKFVVADLLAVISINDVMVSKVDKSGWLWLFLYAYAFRIYFDFSGYTDMAIGMGRLLRVRLPENFAAPYLKPNLTQFWNSWHMSLTQWFRAYVFNPITRGLRSLEKPMPTWLIILAAQLTTMLLIGLWHGITWGFAAWGLWHGAGLFIHNRWAEFSRPRMPTWTQSLWGQRAMSAAGVVLTFNFVAIGWLFFTLTSPDVAWQAMRRLFGLG